MRDGTKFVSVVFGDVRLGVVILDVIRADDAVKFDEDRALAVRFNRSLARTPPRAAP